MNGKNKTMSKSHSLINYPNKKPNNSHLDIKHSKTIDKINHMRYIQYIDEQSACYPYPQLTHSTKTIIQDLCNSKHFKEYITPYYQKTSITCINHSKIRAKAKKRVFNLFLKEEMSKYNNINQLKKESQQRQELTENNNYKCILLQRIKGCNGNVSQMENNNLLIKKIILTRLWLNKTMNIKLNPMLIELNNKIPSHKNTISFRSKTENNKVKHYQSHRKIDLSSNIIQTNRHNDSKMSINLFQKPSIGFTPQNKNINMNKFSLLKMSSSRKDSLATMQNMRLKDVETFFSFFNYNSNNNNT